MGGVGCVAILVLFGVLWVCDGWKVRKYMWEVEYMYWSPDCVENVVIGINGHFPGPTISATAGDTLDIHVTNKLHTEGVVIHWHGILQEGSPWADGTASVSQCAINPGESFRYRFNVPKAGTYFYHGHYGMQRSGGLYGSLIVRLPNPLKDPFYYDYDLSLLLSDWWHQPVHQQSVSLSSKPMRWINEPQSLLINGRGQFNCSLDAQFSRGEHQHCGFRGSEQCSPQILHVLPNKIYRLRLASTTALSSLNLQIGDHKLVVVEADGNYVQPFEVDDLDIYSGDSYSVLINTDKDPKNNYWVSFNVRGRRPQTKPALTILNYLPTPATKLPNAPSPVPSAWDDYAHSKSFTKRIFSLLGTPAPPPTADRRIVLLNTQNKIDGYTKWAINNVSLSLPPTPYLGSLMFALQAPSRGPPDNYPPTYDVLKQSHNPNATYGSQVYTLRFNTTVDVVLQNANALSANTSEIHPWHLHGHDFWVLGYGEGKFSAQSHEKTYNLKNPPLRNTVVIFPFGWTALRFVANNPGVWAFHCHIEPHLHMGMGVIFAEGVRRVGRVPLEAFACGLTAKALMNNTRT